MKVLIAAGGTAGHINPGLAIAQYIQSQQPRAQVVFVGRREGMEYSLVTKAGYSFRHMEVSGFQRRLSAENIKRNLVALKNLALALPAAKKLRPRTGTKLCFAVPPCLALCARFLARYRGPAGGISRS